MQTKNYDKLVRAIMVSSDATRTETEMYLDVKISTSCLQENGLLHAPFDTPDRIMWNICIQLYEPNTFLNDNENYDILRWFTDVLIFRGLDINHITAAGMTMTALHCTLDSSFVWSQVLLDLPESYALDVNRLDFRRDSHLRFAIGLSNATFRNDPRILPIIRCILERSSDEIVSSSEVIDMFDREIQTHDNTILNWFYDCVNLDGTRLHVHRDHFENSFLFTFPRQRVLKYRFEFPFMIHQFDSILLSDLLNIVQDYILAP